VGLYYFARGKHVFNVILYEFILNEVSVRLFSSDNMIKFCVSDEVRNARGTIF
jgi:hypothetical protein